MHSRSESFVCSDIPSVPGVTASAIHPTFTCSATDPCKLNNDQYLKSAEDIYSFNNAYNFQPVGAVELCPQNQSIHNKSES